MLQPLPFTPGATLDITWDWSAWLAAGETIATHSVAPSSGVTKNSSAISGPKVIAWVTMNADIATGTQTAAVCTITTSEGRTDSRTFRLLAQVR